MKVKFKELYVIDGYGYEGVMDLPEMIARHFVEEGKAESTFNFSASGEVSPDAETLDVSERPKKKAAKKKAKK